MGVSWGELVWKKGKGEVYSSLQVSQHSGRKGREGGIRGRGESGEVLEMALGIPHGAM